MENVRNILRYTPKQIVLFVAGLLAILTSITVVAAASVRIEADLGVKNLTTNTVGYKDFVNANDDNVVEFRLHYHNTELPSTNKVAENLSVKIDFPTQPGQVQEVTATVRGDNTNTVVDTASVNLANDGSYLEFIPGSVKWEHNTGTRTNIVYTTENLSDSVVTGGKFVKIENQKPCFEYEAWIYFRAYVRTPDVEIEKQVSINDGDWTEQVSAEGGDLVKYLLTVKNTSKATLKNVIVKDELPAHQNYVSGSTKLFNNANPNGTSVGDGVVTNSGLNIGNLGPGQVAYVGFRVTLDEAADLECGFTKMVNKGIVKVGTLSDSDTATVKTDKKCEQEEPEFDCELLATIVDMEKREVSAELTASHSDDVTVTGYNIDFGDGTSVDEQSASHTYASDGEYHIVGTVTFDVDGETKTAECDDKVTFDSEEPEEKCDIPGKEHLDKDDPLCKEDKPEVLPNTGPGSIIAALFGTGTAAASFRSWIGSRRALKSSLLG